MNVVIRSIERRSLTSTTCGWLVAVVLMFAAPRQTRGWPVVDPAEEVFLQKLTQKQFYDLARQYCEQQIDRATSTDRAAQWQRRLGRTYEEQAWMSDAGSRDGLLLLAVERITEFLKQTPPGSEEQFLLRIQQARLLGQSVRMGLTVEEGGRLFARAVRESVLPAPDPTPERVTAQHAAWQKTLQRSEELLVDLDQQLSQLKRSLDSRRVTEIRAQLKLQLLEIQFLRWRLSRSIREPAGRSSGKLDEQLEFLSRSTREPAVKAAAQMLLAELSLRIADAQRFKLRVRSPKPRDLSDHWALPEFFSARQALSEQNTSRAEQLLNDVSPATNAQWQHLTWLQLESQLGLCELADELRNDTLLAESRTKFEAELVRSGQSLKGVFREAAERTARRFRLVEEVGVQIADLVQTVESEKARGRLDVALRLIDRALVKLPPERRGPRAALLLRAGEIKIASGAWQDAITRLERATTLFAQESRRTEEATADLLKLFALSRLQTSSAGVSAYVQALENHLISYAAEPTIVQAREWLLLAVRNSNPDRAAALAMEMVEESETPSLKIAALKKFTACFREAVARQRQQGTSFENRNELEARFRDQLSKMQAAPLRFPEQETAPFLVTKLGADLPRDLSAGASLADYPIRAAKLRRLLASPTPLSNDEQAAALQRLDMLELVIAARTAASPDKLDEARRRLLESPEEPIDKVEILAQYVVPESEKPGDMWLAGVGVDLLAAELSRIRNTPSRRVSRLLSPLPVVQQLTHVARRPSLASQWMDVLLQQPLTTDQMMQVASVLSAEVGQQKTNRAAKNKTLERFWRKVLSAQKEGSRLWLTAHLRLASQEIQSDRTQAAARRLGVVDTLYPDWGDESLKKEADRLRQQITRE